jgi:hypothetical protein
MATLMGVRVRVLHTIVAMGMDVEGTVRPPDQQAESEKEDDQTDGYFRASDHPFREILAEKNDRQPEDQQCRRMTEPPGQAKRTGAPCAIPRVRKDERRDGGDVVRIGSVPKTQQEGRCHRHQAVATQPSHPVVQSKHQLFSSRGELSPSNTPAAPKSS